MCEMCGCGAVKARKRLVSAVAPTLATIPVRVVTPSAQDMRLARERQAAVQVPLLQRARRLR